ncbi:MAG: hypothetical protein PHD82_08250 [Candidatus Riflebacteria bacterium]|nr:hypothetical protein [Candidatus Riflebacteria bacterium]
MKLELYPEDMLLEYVENRLNGRFDAIIKHEKHLKLLPGSIELSEEFAAKWQAMVGPALKRFIASTFALRGFLFEVDGYSRRFSPADTEFWKDLDFTFSHRGAERLYEQMLRRETSEEPLYPVALPADALLISICHNDFSLYSFPWLEKNKANWLIKACFVAWQSIAPLDVRWQYFFANPTRVELPLREYLIERAADYVAACNSRLQKQFPAASSGHSPRPARGIDITLVPQQVSLPGLYNHVNSFVAEVRKAVGYWSGEGCVGIDDERFIAGSARSYGLDNEFAAFESAAGSLVESMTAEEQIYESLIRN